MCHFSICVFLYDIYGRECQWVVALIPDVQSLRVRCHIYSAPLYNVYTWQYRTTCFLKAQCLYYTSQVNTLTPAYVTRASAAPSDCVSTVDLHNLDPDVFVLSCQVLVKEWHDGTNRLAPRLQYIRIVQERDRDAVGLRENIGMLLLIGLIWNHWLDGMWHSHILNAYLSQREVEKGVWSASIIYHCAIA